MIFTEYLKAFITGGLLCLIGQILIDKTKLTPAKILVSFVVAGVILGGIGVYKYIADFGGAGATVPLTGFGYALSEGVRKGVAEDGFIGIFKGGITAASGGITAALVFGYFAALFSKPSK